MCEQLHCEGDKCAKNIQNIFRGTDSYFGHDSFHYDINKGENSTFELNDLSGFFFTIRF